MLASSRSCRRHNLELIRCLVELRYNALLSGSLYALGTITRNRLVRTSCLNVAGSDANAFATCIKEQSSGLILGLDLSYSSDFAYLVFVACVTLVNLAALIWAWSKTISAVSTVGLTDLEFCFGLNQSYATPTMARVRVFNIVSFVACTAYIFFASPDRMALLAPVLLSPAVNAAISLASLHSPRPRLARSTFAAYMKQVEDSGSFKWSDLAKSAPEVLVSKLTNEAIEDVEQSSSKHLMEA